MLPKNPRFAGFSFFGRSGLLAGWPARAVAPVLAVAAAASDVSVTRSLVLAFVGLGLGLPDFEGFPIMRAQNAPNHERLSGVLLSARETAEGGAPGMPDSTVGLGTALSDGPSVCSVVWTFIGLGLVFNGFEGFPSIKDQNLPNHDCFEGAACSGGCWGESGFACDPGLGTRRAGSGGLPRNRAQKEPRAERLLAGRPLPDGLAGGLPLLPSVCLGARPCGCLQIKNSAPQIRFRYAGQNH
jgi:hypothetical protein